MSNPPALPAQLSRPDAQLIVDALNLRLWYAEQAGGVNVLRYGAKGNNVDCTENVLAAARNLPANGGALIFPAQEGPYLLSGQLNFDNKHSIRLLGAAGLEAGSTAASRLQFTQAGAESAISAKSTYGFTMADLAVYYSNASYTGALIDLTHSAKALDSAYSFFERCAFAGLGVRTALGVNLDKAIIAAFRGCYFQNLDTAIKGKSENSSYSAQIRLDATTFTGMEKAALKNAGSAWYVSGCTFDSPLHSGAAGAYSHDAGIESDSMTVTGCWMGDLTASAGASDWINWKGHGLNVTGNFVGGSTGEGEVTFVRVPDAASSAVQVTGNRFISSLGKTNGVILETGVKNYIIGANEFSSITGKKVSVDGGLTDKGEGFLSN